VGTFPQGIAAGDFNRDGNIDLIVANAADSPSVLIGAGGGAFEPETRIVSIARAAVVAVGDLDGDGFLDAVADPEVGGPLAILRGQGDGTFAVTAIPAPGAKRLALGDLDGDGHLDIVLSESATNDTVDVLLGDGSGGFSAPVTYASGENPIGLALADLNGDGKLDVAVACGGHANVVSVLLGAGDGKLAAHVDYGVGLAPSSVAVGDLDGDGHPELVASNSAEQQVSVLHGSGDGTFPDQVRYDAGGMPETVRIADVTGDGKLDIVTRPRARSACSSTPATARSVPRKRIQPVPLRSARSSADLDADGRADIVSVGEAVTLSGEGTGVLFARCAP
jgi:hypothetical protein